MKYRDTFVISIIFIAQATNTLRSLIFFLFYFRTNQRYLLQRPILNQMKRQNFNLTLRREIRVSGRAISEGTAYGILHSYCNLCMI